jgi:hypothetical protein
MSNITQILSTKKKAGAKNLGLTIPVMMESENRTITEYNVFRRINQLDQFYANTTGSTDILMK